MDQDFHILKICLHVKDKGMQGKVLQISTHSTWETSFKYSVQLRPALEEKKEFKNLVLLKALYNYCSGYLQEETNH